MGIPPEMKVRSTNLKLAEAFTMLHLLVYCTRNFSKANQNLFLDKYDRNIECLGYVDKSSLIIFPRSSSEDLYR